MTYHTRHVGVNIVLIKEDKILLQRRSNTGRADGMLCLPGGHLELGETPRAAAARELLEELGLSIEKSRFTFFTVAFIQTNHENGNVGLYVALRSGENPVNLEHNKCSELVWHDLDDLPVDVHEVFRTLILEGYVRRTPYLEIAY